MHIDLSLEYIESNKRTPSDGAEHQDNIRKRHAKPLYA